MNNHAKQNGIVLLVSLVLLLMLTIIAITAASQSNLQLRISSNSEQKNTAFQAAESGLQHWTKKYFSAANSSSFPQPEVAPVGNSNAQFSVDVVYAGPCSGSGLGRVSLNCFDIRSTGETCNNGDCSSTSIHRQGGQRRQFQE